jgi:hypothetical protein
MVSIGKVFLLLLAQLSRDFPGGFTPHFPAAAFTLDNPVLQGRRPDLATTALPLCVECTSMGSLLGYNGH